MTKEVKNFIDIINNSREKIEYHKNCVKSLNEDIEFATKQIFFEGINGKVFKVRSRKGAKWSNFLFKITINGETNILTGSMFVPDSISLADVTRDKINDLAEKSDIYVIYSFNDIFIKAKCLVKSHSSLDGYREIELSARKPEVYDATDMAEALMAGQLEVTG